MNIREIRAVSLLQPASALLLPLLLPLLFPALAFPADRDSIWKGGVNEYVKYADQDSSDFGRNDHPVVLRPDQIKTVLGYLRIQGKDDAASYEELDPVFTAEQVEDEWRRDSRVPHRTRISCSRWRKA